MSPSEEECVPIRGEVQELITAGGLPSEDASYDEIATAQRLLDGIVAPVPNEEAQALATAFGPDNCYGPAWTLLHLIETAPGAAVASYPTDSANWWIEQLNARAENARKTSKR
jgi:hypothetical protein